jgi:hypothetical protein
MIENDKLNLLLNSYENSEWNENESITEKKNDFHL